MKLGSDIGKRMLVPVNSGVGSISDWLASLLGNTTPSQDDASCFQAAGGYNNNYLACIDAKKQDAVLMGQSDPVGLSDYEAATENPFQLVNPLTGSGPLATTQGIWGTLAVVGIGLVILTRR